MRVVCVICVLAGFVALVIGPAACAEDGQVTSPATSPMPAANLMTLTVPQLRFGVTYDEALLKQREYQWGPVTGMRDQVTVDFVNRSRPAGGPEAGLLSVFAQHFPYGPPPFTRKDIMAGRNLTMGGFKMTSFAHGTFLDLPGYGATYAWGSGKGVRYELQKGRYNYELTMESGDRASEAVVAALHAALRSFKLTGQCALHRSRPRLKLQ